LSPLSNTSHNCLNVAVNVDTIVMSETAKPLATCIS